MGICLGGRQGDLTVIRVATKCTNWLAECKWVRSHRKPKDEKLDMTDTPQ